MKQCIYLVLAVFTMVGAACAGALPLAAGDASGGEQTSVLRIGWKFGKDPNAIDVFVDERIVGHGNEGVVSALAALADAKHIRTVILVIPFYSDGSGPLRSHAFSIFDNCRELKKEFDETVQARRLVVKTEFWSGNEKKPDDYYDFLER